MSTAIVTALMSDIASALGVPGAATVAELIQSHVRKRQAEALDLLLEQLRNGEITAIDAAGRDELISCLWRYSRAAIEGTAHANLRLLARTLAGLIGSESLYAEKFKRYADILSDLTAEEIFVLATLHRICDGLRPRQEYFASESMSLLKAQLVPKNLSEIELHATLGALARTGLVCQGIGTMDDIGGWMTTPLMDEVAGLARLESELHA